MGKKFYWFAAFLLVGLIALMIILSNPGKEDEVIQGSNANPAENTAESEQTAEGRASTDPQRLMIPRWFLTSMTLDGQTVNVPEGALSIQFEDGGKASGDGGCNQFSSQYQAGSDGSIQFEPVIATKMFCDGAIETETAYFTALSKISRFKTEDWKLFLSSADGKTALTFSMPPK